MLTLKKVCQRSNALRLTGPAGHRRVRDAHFLLQHWKAIGSDNSRDTGLSGMYKYSDI